MNILTILLMANVIIAIAMIAIILIQQGKGADAGFSMGGGGAGSLFGSQGSTSFLTKVTWWLAALFFVVMIAYTYLANNGYGESAFGDESLIPQAQTVDELPFEAESFDIDSASADAMEIPEEVVDTIPDEIPEATTTSEIPD